jgi:hypothetical protein
MPIIDIIPAATRYEQWQKRDGRRPGGQSSGFRVQG